MQRDALLLAEIIGAIERIVAITGSADPDEIEATPDRRDSLLWNFTVLGEAANQISPDLKTRCPELPGPMRAGHATASCTATGRSTSRCSPRSPATISLPSSSVSGLPSTPWSRRTEPPRAVPERPPCGRQRVAAASSAASVCSMPDRLWVARSATPVASFAIGRNQPGRRSVTDSVTVVPVAAGSNV